MPMTYAFRCRNGKDVGRSVSAFGFWGDILDSPYHCFGTMADDPELFKQTNKQFTHTAVDVSEHNILVSVLCLLVLQCFYLYCTVSNCGALCPTVLQCGELCSTVSKLYCTVSNCVLLCIPVLHCV